MSNSRLPLQVFSIIAALAVDLSPLSAQAAIPVEIFAGGYIDPSIEDDDGCLELSGSFIPSTPTANDGYKTAFSGWAYAGEYVNATFPRLLVQPGRTYEILVGGENLWDSFVEVKAPQGYQVVLDAKPRPRFQLPNSTGVVVFQLVPKSQDPMLAGLATSVSINRIDWRLPLGTLLDGESAGSIGLIDPGTDTSWSPLYTPARLYYESTSDDVWVYRQSNTLRQVVAPQIAVDIVTIGSTSYEIRCYNPAQMTNTTSTPRQFTGQPFATYRVSSGTSQSGDPTAVVLRFTKELRNVTDATSNPLVTRREFMILERTGTWPAFQWIKQDWYAEGQSPVSETVVQSGGTAQARSETIVVRQPGTVTVTLALTRNYQLISGVGEMLVSETAGTSSPAQTNVAYYTTGGNRGSIQSLTMPGGGWTAYEYTDSRVFRIYRPLGNTPATAGTTFTAGEVVQYNYTYDRFGTMSRIGGISNYVNGAISRSVSLTYGDASNYTETIRTEVDDTLSPPHNRLVRKTRSYPENFEVPWLRDKIYYAEDPDGSRASYTYERGLWNGSTFVNLSNGSASRITKEIRSATGLIAGKSTRDITIRDTRGLLVRIELQVCDAVTNGYYNPSWKLVSWTHYTYNFAGLLTGKVSSSGATYSATYDGFLKTGETDEAGITTTYTYDAASRLVSAVRAASVNIPELRTSYSYDALGNVLTQTTGPVGGEQIVTSKTYDDVGRIVTETPAGGYGALTHNYDPANRTHTAIRADGSTLMETRLIDGRISSRTGTGQIPQYYTYGDTTYLGGPRWERTDFDTSNSLRWSKRWLDGFGNVVKSERPGFGGSLNYIEENFYDFNQNGTINSRGHLLRSRKPGPVAGSYLVSRHDYEGFGRPFRSGLDVDDNNLALASNDRIIESNEYLESFNDHYWWRKDTIAYPFANNGTAVVTGYERTRLTGHPANRLSETQSVDAEGNVTTVAKDVNTSTKTVTVTTTKTGIATSQVEKIENGFSTEITGFDGLAFKTVYDALHRPWKKIDSRNNNTTETTYISGTALVSSVKDATNTTIVTCTYDSLGRKASEKNADNKFTYFAYNRRDQLLRQWGAATYPVAYAYNSYGEKIALRTFRAPAQDFTTSTWPLSDDGPDPSNPDPASWSTGDKTTWDYDAGTGLLKKKTDAAGKSVDYTYNTAHQLATREWARTVSSGPNTGQRVKATYAYDPATGEQTSISYNDGTPTVSSTFTRSGQTDSVTDGATGTRDFVYDPAKPWRLSAEALDTFYGQRVFTRLYDTTAVLGRIRGFQLGATVGSNSDLEQTFGYATSGRFETLTSARNSNATSRAFHYGYETNSSLLKTLWTDDNNFFVVRSFEANRDVLTSVDTKWGASAPSSFAKFVYVSNALVQRQSVEQSGDVFTGYGGGSNTIHQLFTYNDRGEAKTAPTKLGTVAAPGSTLANRQHEFDYDAIGNRKYAGITGNAGDRKNYTSNALNQYSVRDNSTAPFTATQSFTYDDDGNVLDDGLWSYTWDAENRLVQMVATTAAVAAGKPNLWIDFKYDYLGRRVQKRVVNLGTSGEVLSRRYVYDGWNLIAEFNAPGGTTLGTLVRSYTWGLDIARTLTSAGGVGALLQIADHASGKSYHCAYDGNGNVATLINGSTGAVAAVYEYSPYGEIIRADTVDSTIAEQPFRFSTKFYDGETGFVWFGRRFYSPNQGRFLGRDPIEEQGGLNLYGFCGNNAVNKWDLLGMEPGEIIYNEFSDWGWIDNWEGPIDPAWKDMGGGRYADEARHLQIVVRGPVQGSGLYNEYDQDDPAGGLNYGADWDEPEDMTAWLARTNAEFGMDARSVSNEFALDQARSSGGGMLTMSDDGYLKFAPAPNRGLDLSVVGKGALLAATGDGLYTDGSIPWVSGGGEAAATGKTGLMAVMPPTPYEALVQANKNLSKNFSIGTLLDFVDAGLAYTGGIGMGGVLPIRAGIYEFAGASGKTYVGQSSNISSRLTQHTATGKLPAANTTTVRTTAISGGKTAREIAEQNRINELGGIRNLENIRNPIGPARQHIMPRPKR